MEDTVEIQHMWESAWAKTGQSLYNQTPPTGQ